VTIQIEAAKVSDLLMELGGIPGLIVKT